LEVALLKQQRRELSLNIVVNDVGGLNARPVREVYVVGVAADIAPDSALPVVSREGRQSEAGENLKDLRNVSERLEKFCKCVILVVRLLLQL
jgi:hypothetical protein